VTTSRDVLLWIGRSGKRIAVTVVGFSLVALGVVLLVIPGPGLLVIVAGLAVLATQYTWARRALEVTKRHASRAANRLKRPRPSGGPPSG
jgi:uncharacterized protein (TIGR02611 family)